jgi:hypothetical protein
MVSGRTAEKTAEEAADRQGRNVHHLAMENEGRVHAVIVVFPESFGLSRRCQCEITWAIVQGQFVQYFQYY